jgi:hypothetical protein
MSYLIPLPNLFTLSLNADIQHWIFLPLFLKRDAPLIIFCYWAVREFGYSMIETAGRLVISHPRVVYEVRRGKLTFFKEESNYVKSMTFY